MSGHATFSQWLMSGLVAGNVTMPTAVMNGMEDVDGL